ncbi:MAG TPA: hypothetical protein VJA19_09190 [Pseudomonas sp.]|nr:hypothetical protein [Pseudomonas sp.]
MPIENTALRAFTALGVPGAGLLVLYGIVNWVQPGSLRITEGWTGPIALVIVLSTAIILYRVVSPVPVPAPPPAISGPVALSIPRNASFKWVADRLAGAAVVEYLGFSRDELDVRLEPRQIKGNSSEEALENLGVALRGKVRPFVVEASVPGRIVLRVKNR